MDRAAIAAHADEVWAADIVPALTEYIRIPNVSPAFDAAWAEGGHMDSAVALVADWCRARALPGLTLDVHELPGRTPLIVIEIPATDADATGTVVLYGHLDKQPEMTGWRDGLGPWEPVREGDRLYGRGGADDGYAAFASLAAIEANRAGGGRHARCVVLIEASEESGSPDLPAHVDALADQIGQPDLVVCLDSGCADYEHLWLTTSLRGLAGGTLTVEVLEEGIHSGLASGIVPSSFRIARQLLSRIEDETTGAVLVDACHVAIPEDRRLEAEDTGAHLARPPAAEFPLVARPTTPDATEQLLRRSWMPALSIVGADGFPPTSRAGNVLRPATALRLSMRLPPTCDADAAQKALTTALTEDPPYGARVTFTDDVAASGWNAPSFAPWLSDALERASRAHFGTPARMIGEGGTIPFMGMLGERFPAAQFAVTGVLGPESNAHGPNEFLHLPTAQKLTACLAAVLDDHASR